MEDFLVRFMRYTEGSPTPDIFRLWAGIATLAGALERRVWVETNRKVMFPNLFVLLAGPPGVGKSVAIDFARDLWLNTKEQGRSKFYLSPVHVSRAGLVDSLHEAARRIVVPSAIVEYHSLLAPIGELGVLLSDHDLEFLSFLNHLYDNPPNFDERLRHVNAGKLKDIVQPQINILAGSQPSFLENILPAGAWSMGFTSRCIMVYAGEAPPPDLFGDLDPREPQKADLLATLLACSKLMGRLDWELDAQRELQRWAKTNCAPTPEHPKLAHYTPRRILHTIKLCMVAAISRAHDMRITLADVNRARDWLLEAELRMPELFRAMMGKSDVAVLQELYLFAFSIFSREKAPLHEARLFKFVHERAGIEKVHKVIEIAVRSGMFVVDEKTRLYTPIAKHLQERRPLQ